jgi:trimeric autotransporter adhesin
VKDAGGNLVSGATVTFAAPASGASGAFAGGVTTAITNASGVATARAFTANGTAGTYTVTAKVAGVAAPANFTLTNDNVQPVLTTLSPASRLAGGAAFPLTINGNGFVINATVDFGADKGLIPTSLTATQITVTIPAADVATAGTPQVIVNNPAPSVGPSVAATFTVNNPVPTLTSATSGGKTHAAGGTGFTLTVNGTLFVSTSVINFNGKAKPTTFVSATQLTAAIPASDVATAGNVNVTVTNPPPGGGGPTAAQSFTVDGFAVNGPAAPPSVKAGSQAMIEIDVTPTANGFANPVTFTVTGLPLRTSFVFNPTSVTPNGAVGKTILEITTKANSALPPASPLNRPSSPLLRFLPVMWLAALLAGLCAMFIIRRSPQPQLRRYAAIVPLALLLVTGAVLAGCAGGMSGTPKGPAPLIITATSGTLSQTANVTLTVQ